MSMIGRIDFADSSALSTPAILHGLGEVRSNRKRIFTRDAMTFDQFTVDSTGAFLIGELERLDQTLHDPLAAVTWGRDIDLREDVTIADEESSFTNSSFAAAGGITPSGKSWISKDATSITGVALDIGKTVNPLYLWAMEVRYTIPELLSAEKIGRPVDVQKYDGLKLKHQMDIDEMVYIGDTAYNKPGLLNFTSGTGAITPYSVALGAQGSTLWSLKTPDEILADVNTLLTTCWANSAYAIMPSELRLPPTQYGYIIANKVSNAGNVSILEFLKANSLSNAANGKPLNIQPIKWLTGRGAAGANRMMCYTRDRNRVRFPLVPLQRTPLEYRSLFQITTYYGRLGVMEFVYPETIQYADGI